MSRTKILFICSRNQWRSPTAERIFSGRRDIEVRSRGLSPKARRKLSAADVAWAELIFVMESEHAVRVTEGFRDQLDIGLDAGGLDRDAAGRVIARRGQLERVAVIQVEHGLHRTLAEAASAHEQGALVVLQRTGNDFRGRGAAAIDEDDQ